MSTHIGQKIRKIREAEGLSREAFAVKHGLPYGTLMNTEQGRTDPRSSVLLKLCEAYPKYALWLTTGTTQPEVGNISPEMELARKESSGEERAS